MRDLAEFFSQAREKKIYKDISEFRKVVKEIEEIDNGLELDWEHVISTVYF